MNYAHASSYLTQDSLGSVRVVTGEDTAAKERRDYLPFGEEVTVGGRGSVPGYTSEAIRQKFTGYERDNETGLDYAQARYYSPTQGRFTSIDPLDPVLGRQGASDKEEAERQFRGYLSQPQRWNDYAYCLNNPLRYIDPDGFDPLVVNLNVIYDKNANYRAEEKLAFANSYVAQLQQDFGHLDIIFNVTYREGTATNIANAMQTSPDYHKVTSGAVEGAINAFVTRGSVGPSTESTNYNTGIVWISTMSTGVPGDLTHGIIHALGVASRVNGYDAVDRSGTKHDIIRREFWNTLTGNSAEWATERLHRTLRMISAGPGQSFPPPAGSKPNLVR